MEEGKRNQNKTTWILFIWILIIVGMMCFYSTQETHLEYIDGNVIHVGYIEDTALQEGKMSSVWQKNSMASSLMYRALFSIDDTFTSIGLDLAEQYEIGENGTKYTITLKEGLYWSDGEEIKIEDILFTFETMLLSEDIPIFYKNALEKISGAEAFQKDASVGLEGLEIEDNTIIISLDVPYQMFLKVLTQIVILPKHCFEEVDIQEIHTCSYWQEPVVSGMYRMGEQGDTYFSLVYNEWYDGIFSDVEEWRLHIKGSQEIMDYYATNDITEMVDFSGIRGYDKYEVDTLMYRYFMFNLESEERGVNEAMLNYQVREAITLAIDQEKWLYRIYLEMGDIIHSGVPNTHIAYNGFTHTYNPEKAQNLMIESGYDFARPIQLAYYYTDEADEASIFFMKCVAEDLKEIGLQVELLQLESLEAVEAREYDLLLRGLNAFDISQWYGEYMKNHTFSNETVVSNQEFDSYLMQLITETDEASYQQLLMKLQSLEQELLYKIPLFTLRQAVYVNADRISMPYDINFSDIGYRQNFHFEQWQIKKK